MHPLNFDLEAISASSDVEDRLLQVKQALLKLQQPLQCSICLDLLTNPVSTKCGHNFCTACIYRLMQGVRGPTSCPLCLAPVTKRSLENNTRITHLVSAVRSIIDGIKRDCGLINSPQRSRLLAHPTVEDNSDEEEMDEPRRGTRNRATVADEVALPLPHVRSLECSASFRGMKRGRGKRAPPLLAVRNVSAPDLPSLVKESTSNLPNPMPLKDTALLMRKSAVDLQVSRSENCSTSNGIFLPPSSALALTTTYRGRGRGRGSVRARGKLANLGSSSMVAAAEQSSEDELVSVSQVKPAQPVALSDSCKDNHQRKLIGTQVKSMRPKDKVSLWLNKSSAVGFKIGLSPATNDGKSESRATIDGSAAKKVEGAETSDNPAPDFVQEKPLKLNNSKTLPLSGESTVILETPSVVHASKPEPLATILHLPVHGRKEKESDVLNLCDDDELPNCNESMDEFTESTPLNSGHNRLVQHDVEISLITAAPPVSAEPATELDELPDSCPVNTKDVFDILVETARKNQPSHVSSSHLVEKHVEKNATTDDVYFFCTPAEGNDPQVSSKKPTTNVGRGGKKRVLGGKSDTRKMYKRAKTTEPSYPSKSITQVTVSSSVSEKERTKSLKPTSGTSNLSCTDSDTDGKTVLIPSCEAMPPPDAPEAEGNDRRARSARVKNQTSVPTNVRYASELKKRFCEPPKLTAMSLALKDLKSPGWSHVIGAKKDLKSRHIGLNITGGDSKQESNRLELGNELDKTSMDVSSRQGRLDECKILSSGESSVEIDDQTQKYDVEHLEQRPEELTKIVKLKNLLVVMNRKNDHSPKDNGNQSEKISKEDDVLAIAGEEKSPENEDNCEILAAVEDGKEAVISVVPETQSDGEEESPDLDKSSENVTKNSASDARSTGEKSGADIQPFFVRQASSRRPVKQKNSHVNTKAKLVSYSSNNSSSSLVSESVKTVAKTQDESSRSNDLASGQKNADSDQNTSKIAQKSRPDVRSPEDVNLMMANNSFTVSESAQAADEMENKAEENTTKFPPPQGPTRRVMRSGRVRKDEVSTTSSSPLNDLHPKTRLRPSKTKPDLSSGEEKENVYVEGLPYRGSLQKRSKSSVDLNSVTTSVAERAKLRNNLRSANVHLSSIAPEPAKYNAQNAKIQSETSIGAVDGAASAQNISPITAKKTLDFGSDISKSLVEESNTKDLERTTLGTSCCELRATGMSDNTGYCITEATKFSSLDSSSSMPSVAQEPSVEIMVGRCKVDAATEPIVLPSRAVHILKCANTRIDSDDSQGMDYQEHTIIPTVLKNKRNQADLAHHKFDVAVQTCFPRPAMVEVGVQVQAGPMLSKAVQTVRTATTSVAVQAQLPPEGSIVAGVIPFGAVGANCSDRCVGPVGALLTALQQQECLHAVPCSLYQTLLSLLHLAPTHPLPCCCRRNCDAKTACSSGPGPVAPPNHLNNNVAPDDGTLEQNPKPGLSAHETRSSASASGALEAPRDDGHGVTHRTRRGPPLLKNWKNNNLRSGYQRTREDDELTMDNESKKSDNEKPSAESSNEVRCPVSLLIAENDDVRFKKIDDATASSASDNLTVTELLGNSEDEPTKRKTFKDIISENICFLNAANTQLSSEIPFMGEVNLQPTVSLVDIASAKPSPQTPQAGRSNSSSLHNENRNEEHGPAVDEYVSNTSRPSTRVTRRRAKPAEEPTTQSDLFESYDKKAAEESLAKGIPNSSTTSAKKRKVVENVFRENDVCCKTKTATSLPKIDSESTTSEKSALRSSVISLNETSSSSIVSIKTDKSIGKMDKKLERPKYKRIRTLESSDSSSDETPLKKKPSTRDKTTSVSSNVARNSAQTREKNSEELRLDEFDDGVFEYFGFYKKESEPCANTDAKTCKGDAPDQEMFDLPDLNLPALSIENSPVVDALPVVFGTNGESDEDEDLIPGTAEVFKNIEADAALIQRIRDAKKVGSVMNQLNAQDLLSQETIVMSSSVESCTSNDNQEDVLPSGQSTAKPCDEVCRQPSSSDRHDEERNTKLYGTGGSTVTCLTGTTKSLFNDCDRSLRHADRVLRSQDTSVSSGNTNLRSQSTASSKLSATKHNKRALSSYNKTSANASSHGISGIDTINLPGSRPTDEVEPLTNSSEDNPNDKDTDAVGELSHLSMMSTQCEVISTQHRNKVQTEVDILQAKMAALQQQLSEIKKGQLNDHEETDDTFSSKERSDGVSEANEGQCGVTALPLIEDKLAQSEVTSKVTSGSSKSSDGSSIIRTSASSAPSRATRSYARMNLQMVKDEPPTKSSCKEGASSSEPVTWPRIATPGQETNCLDADHPISSLSKSTVPLPSAATAYLNAPEDQDLFSSLPDPEPKIDVEPIGSVHDTHMNAQEEPRRLTLVCTGLAADETRTVCSLLKNLCCSSAGGDSSKPRGEILKTWVPGVTHVIVKCGADQTTERTLKYLYGVASGCWVLSYQWALRSLQEGRLLPEEEFEALDSTGCEGPARGRRMRHAPRRLLQGCVLCFIPPFRDVSLQQLLELVQLCGGQVAEDGAHLKKFPPPAAAQHELRLIVISTDDEEDEQSKQLAGDLSVRYGFSVVASDWLIESVAMHSLVALSPYLLSPLHVPLLEASGVSTQLLHDTQDFV
ncbi:serine-rich adhesin for platelets [Hyalella azteca]|uniref:Serine-rich adhesin for platelets n=1 Tax=Hyalella azteca TaxID=294128 RepID=A0A8B7PMS5_HYAAZ|nr:serine-rich adhesin for platelets [Hyalella azteca]